jgi:uncharacterized membrane protein
VKPPAPKVPDVAQRNIEAIAQLEQDFQRQRSLLDRVSSAVAFFVGSIWSVIVHVTIFTFWFTTFAFDPYPFTFLNLVLGVESVLLSTFVLMSQNRQTHEADRWAHLNLQIDLLAEREATKMLQMLERICARLGLEHAAHDQELREMVRTTHVEALANELNQARTPAEETTPRATDQPGPDGPWGRMSI